MLSTAYRLRLEEICDRISKRESVELRDMIWAEKLAKVNRTAATILRQSRRLAENPCMSENSMDGFLNSLDLGDPDPMNHKSHFDSPEDVANWFHRDNDEEWRTRD